MNLNNQVLFDCNFRRYWISNTTWSKSSNSVRNVILFTMWYNSRGSGQLKLFSFDKQQQSKLLPMASRRTVEAVGLLLKANGEEIGHCDWCAFLAACHRRENSSKGKRNISLQSRCYRYWVVKTSPRHMLCFTKVDFC